MKRREFIGLVGGAAAWPRVARAEQGIRRIAALIGFAEDDPTGDTGNAELPSLTATQFMAIC